MSPISKLMLSAVLATGCADSGSNEGQPIGPRGGVLVSDDGLLTVEIRSGALEDEMQVRIIATECEGADSVACYDFTPWGVMLAVPASIVFDCGADGTADLEAHELRLEVEGGDGWDAMADANHDSDEGTVWGSAMYLTSVNVIPAH